MLIFVPMTALEVLRVRTAFRLWRRERFAWIGYLAAAAPPGAARRHGQVLAEAGFHNGVLQADFAR